jgi:hypothetical protein
MVVSRHQNAERNHDLVIANKPFESVALFIHLGSIVTNQNYVHEGIKGSVNLGNACYHSVQSLLSSRLLSKTS